jgi:hypothetical protein
MPFSLILIIFLLTPIGESAVVQEIKVESEEKCLVLKDFLTKNTEIQADFPVSRAVAACQKRIET